MSVLQRYNPYFKRESNIIHNNDGIIDLSKVDNSIFGIGCQINKLKISNEQSVEKKIIDDETESTYSSTTYSSDSKSTTSTISKNSQVETYGEMYDSSELTDSDEQSSYTISPSDFTYLPNIKYVKKYYRQFYNKLKHSKPSQSQSQSQSKHNKNYEYYSGGIISDFNKDSPFISMMINKRIGTCKIGPSCHIAAFVPDLGMKNKFTNWAMGKLAIGENSERMRFGNNNLSTHAEMDALKKLDGLFRVKKCKKEKMDLVVIRVNKSGDLCESAPCYHCTKELQNTKVVSINKLYFSRWDGTITCVKFSEWVKNDKHHISKGWRMLHCGTVDK
jgi:hypothetical protein